MSEVAQKYVTRTLWYLDDDGKTISTVDETAVSGLGPAVVVLGEPGMGKSKLLEKLGNEQGAAICRAGKFIRDPNPRAILGNAARLVIDGLDEVVGWSEGSAVDQVLRRLSEADYPAFILSCRVGDWHAALSAQMVKETYGTVRVLHLKAFSRTEQLTYLTHKVGSERAEALISHYNSFDLDLLGNPQTLNMISKLSERQSLPNTLGDLLDASIDQIWCEHRFGYGANELTREEALDAAGAAFAALILTGSTAIVRHGIAHAADDELPFAEVDRLTGGQLDQSLKSRLYEGSADRFSYWHRRIGEFLGARWLGRQADNPTKRRRILQLFHGFGLVPASLRGVHAWMARDSKLAPDVISKDPLGIVEYGDADSLAPDQARQLFLALIRLGQEDPHFWRRDGFRARSLVGPNLTDEVNIALSNKTVPLSFRVLLTEQMVSPSAAERHREQLRALLVDRDEVFVLRDMAGKSLAFANGENWPFLLEELRQQGTEDSTRIAYRLIRKVGIEILPDNLIVEIMLAHSGLTLSAVPKERERALSVRFYGFANTVPVERIPALLDTLADYAASLLPQYPDIDSADLVGCIRSLISRAIESDNVAPLRLLSWLVLCRSSDNKLTETEAAITDWLRTHTDARFEIIRHVLFDTSEENFWQSSSNLRMISSCFELTQEDVVALLKTLDPMKTNDMRWTELLQLIQHTPEFGHDARDAARPFAQHNKKLLNWLSELPIPKLREWEETEKRYAEERKLKRQQRDDKARAYYEKNFDKINAGEFSMLFELANAYFGFYHEIGQHCGAHERIAEWLGSGIAAAAHRGFVQHLRSPYPRLNACRTAVLASRRRLWNPDLVLLASLAEALRTGATLLGAVSDNHLLLGLFQFWIGRLGQKDEFEYLRRALETEIRSRNLWERAHRLFITPQLKHCVEHVDQLYPLMHSESDRDMAVRLALDWLERCPSLHTRAEAEMVDRVLRSSKRDALIDVGKRRRATVIEDDRRRMWDAVEVLVDFPAAKARLVTPLGNELIWDLRDRVGASVGRTEHYVDLDVDQLEWIVTCFRHAFPAVEHPLTSYSDRHPWNATDFLRRLIGLIGKDTSAHSTRALEVLRDMPNDGYTQHIKVVLAEHKRKRVETAYKSASFAEFRSIVTAGPPVTATDLRAVVLGAFETVQNQLRSDDISSYRSFYLEDGKHKSEEVCRDELIKMLRAIEPTLEYTPEQHLADAKRVDIVARRDRHPILPIEIKGTWNRALWTAADQQLDKLYNEDWRAECGIYLVLWFGPEIRIHPSPIGEANPTSPDALREALTSLSQAAKDGRVDIIVLDLTRPVIKS